MARRPSPEKLGRVDAAREIIAKEKDLSSVDLFHLNWATRVGFLELEHMILTERLNRGEITMADLTPKQRRAFIDPTNVDVHALAAGPIMQPERLFLPAGKLSMAETREREAAQIIRDDAA